MNHRYAHLPVVFMRAPRVPTRIQLKRQIEFIRFWAGVVVGTLLFYWGAVEAVKWALP